MILLIQFEIFLLLYKMSNFWSKPRLFRSYVMRLWISFKTLILFGFLLFQFSRGREPCLATDRWGWNPGSILGFYWPWCAGHLHTGEWVGFLVPNQASTDIALAGGRCRSVSLLLSMGLPCYSPPLTPPHLVGELCSCLLEVKV